ncbi:MAG: aminotransferase class I/II-fold pyridoxal phosphate-dependent enzyme [Solirubrobacterales bacterium]|nr:aminotransferase class I/II-fold pyridoxal phosphate-dependent enzyme [Solirubrobacterales bacterium]
MQIRPFAIERFYARWEFRAEWMLSSSDCETRPLGELLALEPNALQRLSAMRLGYTEVAGSPELLAAVSALYEQVAPADVLTLAAAEEGIFTAYHALLGSGDHAIVEAPCYGSAIELARSTGAAVDLWQRRYEDGWAHDLQALEAQLRPETKLIYINSPHNPTGTQMERTVLERVVELARERSIVLFGDEVYRGLEHDPAATLPAVCDLYERGISLGTVSKAHGLPGLRIGWLACRDPSLLARITDIKLYTTICSSAPSELLVALALRHAEHFVQSSRALVLANLPLIEDFIARRPELMEWVPPSAGPIGFPRLLGVEDVAVWCEQTAERASVLVLPGTVYDEPGHVRLGFGRAQTAQALERLDSHLA